MSQPDMDNDFEVELYLADVRNRGYQRQLLDHPDCRDPDHPGCEECIGQPFIVNDEEE